MAGFTAPAHGPTGTVAAPLATADLATFMRAPDSTEMQQPLTTAISIVERRCGPITGGQRNYLAEQSSGANRTIYPMWNMRALTLPIQGLQLTSLDVLTDPYGLDVTGALTAPDIDWMAAVIVCPYMRRGVWQVTATTTRDAVDAATLKEAALVIGKKLWESRRGQQARSAAYGGEAPAIPAGFAVPSAAKELMNDLLLIAAG